jgi:hypothetical protein
MSIGCGAEEWREWEEWSEWRGPVTLGFCFGNLQCSNIVCNMWQVATMNYQPSTMNQRENI